MSDIPRELLQRSEGLIQKIQYLELILENIQTNKSYEQEQSLLSRATDLAQELANGVSDFSIDYEKWRNEKSFFEQVYTNLENRKEWIGDNSELHQPGESKQLFDQHVTEEYISETISSLDDVLESYGSSSGERLRSGKNSFKIKDFKLEKGVTIENLKKIRDDIVSFTQRKDWDKATEALTEWIDNTRYSIIDSKSENREKIVEHILFEEIAKTLNIDLKDIFEKEAPNDFEIEVMVENLKEDLTNKYFSSLAKENSLNTNGQPTRDTSSKLHNVLYKNFKKNKFINYAAKEDLDTTHKRKKSNKSVFKKLSKKFLRFFGRNRKASIQVVNLSHENSNASKKTVPLHNSYDSIKQYGQKGNLLKMVDLTRNNQLNDQDVDNQKLKAINLFSNPPEEKSVRYNQLSRPSNDENLKSTDSSQNVGATQSVSSGTDNNSQSKLIEELRNHISKQRGGDSTPSQKGHAMNNSSTVLLKSQSNTVQNASNVREMVQLFENNNSQVQKQVR